MNARATFSKALKKIRVEKGFSQENLAFEAGLSMRSISLLEGNKQQPTITTIENLSKALGITMVEFIIEAEV
ncbi:MAG: transcriptional regulator [Porticoccaceae bacterium]|nr:MAG: transcriptional regulator [Porticoccaceae bacterium]